MEGLSVKNVKWVFVLFSIAAILAMVTIGIFIGLRSILGILFGILLLILVMGYGFKTKKKYRDQGLL